MAAHSAPCVPTGICLLIAGSYTPFLVRARCFVMLCTLWTLTTLNVVHKAYRRTEIGLPHLAAFLAMGE